MCYYNVCVIETTYYNTNIINNTFFNPAFVEVMSTYLPEVLSEASF